MASPQYEQKSVTRPLGPIPFLLAGNAAGRFMLKVETALGKPDTTQNDHSVTNNYNKHTQLV
jgi:hypothetical protein